MKKIISLFLCVLLSGVLLVGCGLIDHNYERDYAQVIATIEIPAQTVQGKRVVLDENSGLPKTDYETGEPLKEDVNKQYPAQTLNIYKSQLVNYVNYYLRDDINNGTSVDTAVKNYVDRLISTELLLIEADKLFDAGILYWTQAEVDEIQRSVYIAISDEIFNYKNQLLKSRDLPELPAKGGDPSTGETTYPVQPVEEDEVVSPAYYLNPPDSNDDSRSHQWFDGWYTNDTWYIQGDNYKTALPGMFNTSLADKSLAIEAFNNYLEYMIEYSQNIIGLTDEQRAEIKQNIAEINRIRDTKGIPYVYPQIGRMLMFKLMVGNSYIKNLKLTKLQNYHTQDLTSVDRVDVTAYYNQQVKKQKTSFATRSNYDSAVTGNQTILYTPSDRYVWVKHILLPFSDAQSLELQRIKAQEGNNKQRIIERRAALAKQITVYPHVNGEDDLKNPRTVAQVTKEITEEMNNYTENPYYADRAFTDFIYKYNTDPGIFGSEKGYAVVHTLEADEQETYMEEFANAARTFRDKDYGIGQVYNEDGVPYIVTDYGIHIMYYSYDPAADTTKGLDSYTTDARLTKIYDLMEEAKLAELRAIAYEDWESRYTRDFMADYSSRQSKIINKFIDELQGK